MKKIIDQVIKSKDNDVDAMYNVFVYYKPLIEKYAKMLHDIYHAGEKEELMSLGYDGLMDAIKSVDKSSNFNFSSRVKYHVIRKMLKDKYFQLRKIVGDAEIVFGKKYSISDKVMTEYICDMVWEALEEFYPESNKNNYINQNYPNILKDIVKSKGKLIESDGLNYIPSDYENYKYWSNEKDYYCERWFFLEVRKMLGQLYHVNYDDLKDYKVDIELSDNKLREFILEYAEDRKYGCFLKMRYCIYPSKEMSDEDICKYFDISMEKLQSIYKKEEKDLNQCEIFVMNVKSGINNQKFISLGEIGKFYNYSSEYVRNRINKMLKSLSWFLLRKYTTDLEYKSIFKSYLYEQEEHYWR